MIKLFCFHNYKLFSSDYNRELLECTKCKKLKLGKKIIHKPYETPYCRCGKYIPVKEDWLHCGNCGKLTL